MDQTMTLLLDPPVRLGEAEYSELQLREPTVGEDEEASQAKTYSIRLLSLIAGVPEAAVRKMPRGVLMQAMDFFDKASAETRGTSES